MHYLNEAIEESNATLNGEMLTKFSVDKLDKL